ncbi:MAG: Zn-ribbon domain-containing OB-fold protein [Euryarchaeota archaeon]|nr:Zn-ribbon domain-containing OB-fold protein [Euryarchaeota archaeon]
MGVPRFWREQPHRYRLEGTRCTNCDRVYFPPRWVCPVCRRESVGKMERHKMDGTGTVVASTVVHDPAPGFEDQVPYAVAIIELDEGCRLTTQVSDVADPHDVVPGMRVKSAFRRIQSDGASGVIYYGTKFVPLVEQGSTPS